MSLINQKHQTLLVCGENYTDLKDVCIEKNIVTIFPFGVWGPKMRGCIKVLQKECFRKYMCTHLPHFICGNTVEIMYHILSRILSFETGVMAGGHNFCGLLLAERLEGLTQEDTESTCKDSNKPLTEQITLFTNSISTPCQALGYTPEAAKLARKEVLEC